VAYRVVQVGVVNTGQKCRQGQRHADATVAIGAMAGGAALRIQARPIRFGVLFGG
jgi:hypothetical protein